jgi:hypothetical protein
MSNIVITRTSRGIVLVSLATVLELASAGHQVVATMRNPAGSPELGEQAAKEKLPVRIETMDVDSDESVKQAFGFRHGFEARLEDAQELDPQRLAVSCRMVGNLDIERLLCGIRKRSPIRISRTRSSAAR